MQDLRDYTAFFYFYIEDEEVYIRMKLEGMKRVDKMSAEEDEEDEKAGEGMRKSVASMLNVDIEKVRRVTKDEYVENTDEEEEE